MKKKLLFILICLIVFIIHLNIHAEENGNDKYFEVKWEIKFKNKITSILSSQDKKDMFIYLISEDGYIYAIEQDKGRLIWKFKTKDKIIAKPQIRDNILYVSSLDGNLYAIDINTGNKLLSTNKEWPKTTYSELPDKKNGLIYIASNDKNVYALEINSGKPFWTFTTESSGIYTEMVIYKNLLFIPSCDGNLYCVYTKNGELKWKQKIGNFLLASPAVQNESIFLATDHGEIIAINIDDGNIIWQLKAAERIQRSPQIFENMLFLCVDQGFICGIDTLNGDIVFKYFTDYYPLYILYYDYNSEMFFYFSDEEKLIAFKRIEKEEDVEFIQESALEKEYIKPPIPSSDGRYYLYSEINKLNLKGDNNIIRTEIADNVIKIVSLTKSTHNDVSPQWCPDSTAIVFSSNRDGNYNIYKMDMAKLDIFYYNDSTNCTRTGNESMQDLLSITREDVEKKYLTQLTNETTDEDFPLCSPIGDKIVYKCFLNNNWDLWIMNTSGENKLRLTYEFSFEEDIKWSPDGTKIIFVSSRSRNKDIFMINPDGTNLLQLTFDYTDDIHPEWISDSTIVFEKVSEDNKYSNIWVINKDGKNARALTKGHVQDHYPKPSPDGKKIIFISNRNKNSDNLWIINNSGKKPMQITNLIDEVNIPAWFPDGERIIFFIKDTATGEIKPEILNVGKKTLLENFIQAEEFTSRGKYYLAIEIYKNIIEDYPDQKISIFIESDYFYISSYLAALYKLAMIENMRKNYNQMILYWNMIALDESGDYDDQKIFSLAAMIRTKLMDIEKEKGEYEKAIEGYSKILKIFPDKNDLWGYPLGAYVSIRIAECYEMLKKYQEAIDAYINAQKKYSDAKIMLSKDYIGTMGLCFINIGRIYELHYHDYEKAFQYYIKILEKYPFDKIVTGDGNFRDSYVNNALNSLRDIYINGKIDIDIVFTWYYLCKRFYDDAKYKELKNGQLLTILTELEKLMNGSKLLKLQPQLSKESPKYDKRDLKKILFEKPDTLKVVFSSRKKEGEIKASNYEIYSINEDGTGIKRITYNEENDYRPVWSPDGVRIVYYSLYNNNYEIFTIYNNGTSPLNLTKNNAYDFEPAWSPEGTRISFTSDRDNNMEIYIMNEDGSSQTNISKNPARDFESNWEPSGNKIIFTSDRDGNLEIYMVDLLKGETINISQNPAFDHEPVFSPLGDKIVFTSNRDKNEEIYIMNSDGTEQKNLTNNDSFDYNPAWSSDSQHIFFVSNRNKRPKIFRMDKDGTHQVQITFDEQSYDIQPHVLK
ncbi:MAG: PD40 domain-containing protein [Candidatus Firestonebacteria bacterium]|nr:PD40 domain-containing protein [Candidatus Firestonebacteria bacterium]